MCSSRNFVNTSVLATYGIFLSNGMLFIGVIFMLCFSCIFGPFSVVYSAHNFTIGALYCSDCKSFLAIYCSLSIYVNEMRLVYR